MARVRCVLCQRSAIGGVAVTCCRGDPMELESWRRDVQPLCSICEESLKESGSEGVRRGDVAEVWFVGHEHGLFAQKPPGPMWRQIR